MEPKEGRVPTTFLRGSMLRAPRVQVFKDGERVEIPACGIPYLNGKIGGCVLSFLLRQGCF